MNANSTAVPKKLVDPRTHINMVVLLARMEEQKKARYSVSVRPHLPPLQKMKPLEPARVPPVLFPALTPSQRVILSAIQESLAAF